MVRPCSSCEYFKQGVASLDMVEWAVSVVVFFLPFLGLYLVVILVYASLVTFDEHGVHERKLGGVSFTPWNQVKNIQFEVSYGRIVIQTDRKKVLFTPWSLDSSDYQSGIHWLREKAAALKK